MLRPVLKASGLHTAANAFTGVPEGALAKAENVIIRFPGVIEPRRGQYVAPGYTFGTAASNANTLTFFQDSLYIHYGSGTVSQFAHGRFFDLPGTYPPPANQLGLKTKFLEAQQDLFFTTDNGVYELDQNAAVQASPAGIKRAMDILSGGTVVQPYNVATLDIAANAGGVTTGAWMQGNTKVGYVVLWYRKDASGRLISSAPSGRTVYANTTASTLQWLQFYVPAIQGTSSLYSFQVFRTPQSVTQTTDPGDNFYLAFESSGSDPETVAAGSASASGHSVLCTWPNNFHVGDIVQVSVASASDTSFNPNGPGASMPAQITSASIGSFTYSQAANITGPVTNVGAITVTPFAFSVSDYAPDTMLGAPLYTNPLDGDGSLIGISDNGEPPWCLDVAYWNFRNWYANTKSKQRYQVQLLGVNAGSTPNPQGLVDGDLIQIGNRQYIAKNTATLANQFTITSSSTPALNIETTAKSLCSTINNDQGNSTLIAFYISGNSGAPGLIQLEERGVGGPAFSIAVNRSTAWASNLSNALSSTNDAAPNRLFFSKRLQPEAVPLLNYLDVGSRSKDILRILPLRDKLYVFKSDGIFIVSGSAPPYRVDQLDNTSRLIAPETAVNFANQIYALTNQGLVSVSELGVQIQSAAIDDQLLPLFASLQNTNAIKNVSFGVPYESERTFILALPTDSASTWAKQQFWFNYETKAWTHHPIARTCGGVNRALDLLYMGAAPGALSGSNSIYVERKTFTDSDFAEDSLAGTISGVGSSSIVFSTPAAGSSLAAQGISVGDLLVQGNNVSVITAIDTPATFFLSTADPTTSFSIGPATVNKAIPCEVVWQLNVDDAPGQMKHWREGSLHFRRFASIMGAQAETSTEADLAPTYTTLSTIGFGQAVWDSTSPIQPSTAITDLWTAWGQPTAPKNERFLVGANKQRSAYLYVGFRISEAQADWALQGLTLTLEQVSERTTVR